MYDEEDLLPLSGLQHMAFCERRWALVHLERQWEENLFTAEGRVAHEKAHSGDVESRPGALLRRALPVHSFRLGLSGQCDVVEFTPGDAGIAMPRRRGLWQPYPIEYKRRAGRHGGDAYLIQLCAQALCLEEMLGCAVPCGALFDSQTRRRLEVPFDAALRAEVAALAERMHALGASGRTPPAEYQKKCEACSMHEVCLPKVAGAKGAAAYLRRAVAANLRGESGDES
jgi:CRISPR-associated exonuclease Cas4